ncbi:transferase [Fennellomyces sp. T-0311]|nr:transferase [Fennellomyces sp. T-0311]
MVRLPPKHREFVQPETLPSQPRFPAPAGISRVVMPIYTKFVIFFENDENVPNFMPPEYIKRGMARALSSFYLLAGRLLPEDNGRYSVGSFEKGALFQSVLCTESLQACKDTYFSYQKVPIADYVPLHQYNSIDAPLAGIQVNYLRGGVALGFSFHHSITDGLGITAFVTYMSYTARKEMPLLPVLYDWDREPLRVSPKYDVSKAYPVVDEPPIPQVWNAPSEKRLVVFSLDQAEQLRKAVEAEMDKPGKISTRDALTALMHRVVVRARRTKGPCDLVFVTSPRYAHPDKRMRLYFGNYIVNVCIPDTPKDLLSRKLSDSALRIRERVNSVDIEYVETLENYLNQIDDTSCILTPVRAFQRTHVGWTDWSRFTADLDFGYGKIVGFRSYVDPSPLALITVLPLHANFDIVVQLDPESMRRLEQDEELKKYATGCF